MANSKLPRDAEGLEIPLDTECLYTYKCEKQYVLAFTYDRKEDIWEIETDTRLINSIHLYLTPPDSWERLEEDLGRAAERDVITSQCRYFNTTNRCVNCPIHNDTGGCTHKDERAFKDILNRIRKLRGEGE